MLMFLCVFYTDDVDENHQRMISTSIKAVKMLTQLRCIPWVRKKDAVHCL